MKKTRLFAALIVLVLLIVGLTGCEGTTATGLSFGETVKNAASNNENAVKAETEPFEMEHIGVSSDHGFDYYRDTVTDVIYVLHHFNSKFGYAGAGGSGLTVMLDPETGLPLTYTRYMDLHNTTTQN